MKYLATIVVSLCCLTAKAQSETGGTLPADTTASTLLPATEAPLSTSLNEVTVVAQRPLVTQKADRISYDVKGDEEAKTTTVIEMLKKVPYVTVDGQGNILVKGSGNFKIYKNGRPNPSFSNNAKEVLAAIPANAVKRIEVITEPGAKYDAEGLDGILNIVMDEEARMGGFVGNARIGWQPVSGQHNGSLWGTVQRGKFTLSLNYNTQRISDYATTSISDAEHVYKESGNQTTEHSEQSNPGWFHGGGLEASYEAGSLNLITASVNAWYYDVDVIGGGSYQMTDRQGAPLMSYHQCYTAGTYQNYLDLDGHIDYQHLTRRKGESLNLSYLLSTTRTHNCFGWDYTDIVNYPDYTRSITRRKNDFTEHTFQFDWTRPLWEHHTLNLGAKYILRKNDSESGQELSTDRTGSSALSADTHSFFSHTTQVTAAYGEYTLAVKALTFIGGLRYEYAFLGAKFHDGSAEDFHRSLSDWVPSLTASWRINDANSLKLNYAMRINRPGISFLNPAVFTYPTSVSSGNPGLESSNQHNVTLGYSLMKPKLTVNLSLRGARSNDLIMEYRYIQDNIIHTSYGNIGRYRSYGLSTYLQWKPLEKTTLMLNSSISHDSRENKSQGIRNQRWACYAYAQYTQKLPWKLQTELFAGYNNWGLEGLYAHADSRWFYGLNLQRSFLKDDRMTVRLNTYNPIHKKYDTYKETITYGDYTGCDSYRNHARYLGFSVSLRIGSLNASVKKTSKTVSNDDLQGRK